jgi:hypothetical protein
VLASIPRSQPFVLSRARACLLDSKLESNTSLLPTAGCRAVPEFRCFGNNKLAPCLWTPKWRVRRNTIACTMLSHVPEPCARALGTDEWYLDREAACIRHVANVIRTSSIH